LSSFTSSQGFLPPDTRFSFGLATAGGAPEEEEEVEAMASTAEEDSMGMVLPERVEAC